MNADYWFGFASGGLIGWLIAIAMVVLLVSMVRINDNGSVER
ncbi:hypothetical protein QCE49_29125 [Caballeronia sp. LZ008]|nr:MULTISPECIES: hypothetical protein [unclassified Caballeronia]MDR5797466.1 hypothetical protein [Caballeronia sp. LZ008]